MAVNHELRSSWLTVIVTVRPYSYKFRLLLTHNYWGITDLPTLWGQESGDLAGQGSKGGKVDEANLLNCGKEHYYTSIPLLQES